MLHQKCEKRKQTFGLNGKKNQDFFSSPSKTSFQKGYTVHFVFPIYACITVYIIRPNVLLKISSHCIYFVHIVCLSYSYVFRVWNMEKNEKMMQHCNKFVCSAFCSVHYYIANKANFLT